jgi:hypothetical protein
MQIPQLELQNWVPRPHPNGGASGRGPSRDASRDGPSVDDSIPSASSRGASTVEPSTDAASDDASAGHASSLGEVRSTGAAPSTACPSEPASATKVSSPAASFPGAAASVPVSLAVVAEPPHPIADEIIAATKKDGDRMMVRPFRTSRARPSIRSRDVDVEGSLGRFGPLA